MTSILFSVLIAAVTFSVPVFAYEGTDANGFQLQVYATDSSYPIELLKKNPKIPVQVQSKRSPPWYEKKGTQRGRIFAAGQMTGKMKDWDGLDRNLFLQKLDLKGARGIASEYPQFTVDQLKAAESELRKVKGEP